jgi:hypothetical protein
MCGEAWPERLPESHATTWEKDDLRVLGAPRIAVECKPLVGDDYPAILRFVKNLPARAFDGAWRVVLAGAVQSRTVPLAAIKQFFALSHILLVLVDEVEAAEFPATAVCFDKAHLPDAHATYMQPREDAQRCLACLTVQGQQTPAVLPLTLERCWRVLEHHATQDNGWSYVQQGLFRRARLLAMVGDVVHLAPLWPSITEDDVMRLDCFDVLQQTLTRLMGRPMTVVLDVPTTPEDPA